MFFWSHRCRCFRRCCTTISGASARIGPDRPRPAQAWLRMNRSTGRVAMDEETFLRVAHPCSVRSLRIEWPGEDDFDGYIAYASFSKANLAICCVCSWWSTDGVVLFGGGFWAHLPLFVTLNEIYHHSISHNSTHPLVSLRFVVSGLLGSPARPVPGVFATSVKTTTQSS